MQNKSLKLTTNSILNLDLRKDREDKIARKCNES